MIHALIPAIAGIIGTIVDKAVPDKDEADKLKASLTQQILKLNQEELKTASGIIMAEVQDGNMLTRSWRPITALVFVALVVAHWLGFTAENLSQETIDSLLDLVKIMIGGYVVSRGGERIVKEWKK